MYVYTCMRAVLITRSARTQHARNTDVPRAQQFHCDVEGNDIPYVICSQLEEVRGVIGE